MAHPRQTVKQAIDAATGEGVEASALNLQSESSSPACAGLPWPAHVLRDALQRLPERPARSLDELLSHRWRSHT